MLRVLILCAVLLSGCAPVDVEVPVDVATVPKATEAPLNARVGVRYPYLSDALVVDFYAHHKNIGWHQKFAVYHPGAASRAILTRAFKEIFTDVRVIEGMAGPGDIDLDIVIVPKLTTFTFGNKHPVIDQALAKLTYEIEFFSNRGAYLGHRNYSGESKPDDTQKNEMRFDQSKIVLAMERAAAEIVTMLPKDEIMARWRTP